MRYLRKFARRLTPIVQGGERCCTDGLVCQCDLRTCTCTCPGCPACPAD